MGNDDAWMYYHDEVVEQIDLNVILKTAESVCSALGFKLGKTWEAYETELPKLPWTSIYLTSLELQDYDTDNGKGAELFTKLCMLLSSSNVKKNVFFFL